MKKFLKGILIFLIGLIFIGGLLFSYINLAVPTPQAPYVLGTTFSWKYAEALQLDWKEVYTAMLDDLKVRKIRIPVYWDYIEQEQGTYKWDRLDYEVAEAEKRDARLTIAIGRKVPRWPECFIPEWAKDDTALRQERLLIFTEAVVKRYKDSPAVERWQVENEPFLKFGTCPPFDKDFFDQELAVARAADGTRPIVTTDSGELGIWLRAAKRGDIFGTTMYRNVYTENYGYYEYPVGPKFFQFKRWVLSFLPRLEKSIVIELQTEPWMQGWITDFPVHEQLQAMDGQRIRDNVQFARQSGFDEIFTWGVEWWYWLKVEQGEDEVWETARDLFDESAL